MPLKSSQLGLFLRFAIFAVPILAAAVIVFIDRYRSNNISGISKASTPSTGKATTYLRHNKLLIPVLVVAMIIGFVASVLFQSATHPSFSILNFILISLISLLSGIGIISIIWSIALKWPVAGGMIMFVLGSLFFDGVLAYIDGRMSLSNHNPALLVLLVASVILYAVAGVMLLLSKKVVKTEAQN